MSVAEKNFIGYALLTQLNNKMLYSLRKHSKPFKDILVFLMTADLILLSLGSEVTIRPKKYDIHETRLADNPKGEFESEDLSRPRTNVMVKKRRVQGHRG